MTCWGRSVLIPWKGLNKKNGLLCCYIWTWVVKVLNEGYPGHQSSNHSSRADRLGFPVLVCLDRVKWRAGTQLNLISLSIHSHSHVNVSVCQSDQFCFSKCPEEPRSLLEEGMYSKLAKRLFAGFNDSLVNLWWQIKTWQLGLLPLESGAGDITNVALL